MQDRGISGDANMTDLKSAKHQAIISMTIEYFDLEIMEALFQVRAWGQRFKVAFPNW